MYTSPQIVAKLAPVIFYQVCIYSLDRLPLPWNRWWRSGRSVHSPLDQRGRHQTQNRRSPAPTAPPTWPCTCEIERRQKASPALPTHKCKKFCLVSSLEWGQSTHCTRTERRCLSLGARETQWVYQLVPAPAQVNTLHLDLKVFPPSELKSWWLDYDYWQTLNTAFSLVHSDCSVTVVWLCVTVV